MNATSQARLADIHPILRTRAYQFEQLLGFEIEIVQGRRSFPLQAAYYAQGRALLDQVNSLRAGVGLAPITAAENKVVTRAQPGYGWHEYALAFDAAPIDKGVIDWNVEHPTWKAMLAKAPSVGLAEGAQFRTFPDNPHFFPHEIPASPDDETRYVYREAGMEEVWQELARLYGLK